MNLSFFYGFKCERGIFKNQFLLSSARLRKLYLSALKTNFDVHRLFLSYINIPWEILNVVDK